MARKISKKLVVLSSSVIISIYAAGYTHTRPAAERIAAAQNAAIVLSTAPAPGRIVAEATLVSGYRDGTYSGLGQSRFGDVEVELTVAGGRIAAARISRITTSYPRSKISGLTDQVVTRQGGEVDLVSGATASTQAFREAVRGALQQVQAGLVTTPQPSTLVATPIYTYKDGTYVGYERSFFGRSDATLKIVDGRIVSAEIRWQPMCLCDPYNEVIPLLFERVQEQVLEQQAGDIDIVSGATYSMLAARSAIQQALSQARG